ncbi:MAG: putative N-acetyltransferase YhdJ [Pseudohongiella sp.]|nr:MAG: putative N-acetyltransferase YhdJ [Pseudohongiella sp.]
MYYKLLQSSDSAKILDLALQLNPETDRQILADRLEEMFGHENYYCFGFYVDEDLIGISSGWLTTRFYSGKQLEIDNVIIAGDQQSKGYGKEFLTQLESWARDRGCSTVELNTYVNNARSHKFYFNEDYRILGFHFQKKLD